MLQFIVRRALIAIPTLLVISIVSFVIIQLPPGDFFTAYIAQLEQEDAQLSPAAIASLRERYGLDQPLHVQYLNWISGVLRGDFGYSLQYSRPVSEIVWERLGLTFAVALASLLFSWVVAFPIGFYSAVKQYTPGDYLFSALGFIGLAVPNFMLALVLLYFSLKFFGRNLSGLFSPEYIDAPWSLGKLLDLLAHIWIPMLIVGTAGTAELIRVMRNNLLDELRKPYVAAARARGISELRLLLKYPVRVAINPFLSTIGWLLPSLISGTTIVAVVLNLPTEGPVLLKALLAQDMYLAGSFILLLATLTVLGTLISDILLAVVDPRIRYD